MKISRRDDFALVFMKVLAEQYCEKFISVSLIAKKTKLSPLFLKHIASSLRDHRLIESREGIAGGYRLSREPKAISVAQILKATSEKIINPSCVHGTCRLEKKNCTCFSFWNKVNSKFLDYLGDITLAQFSKY
ncbi:Rrf2 family transcriptional regulator [Candidatus Gottesmanbacteria bacterium]|nr:Rrf2 family transcriptional regulator [Candidatus Gottesmanbacteria bacterium]